ncbi:hypothetical protein T10_156, partial [Trichinella papuae]
LTLAKVNIFLSPNMLLMFFVGFNAITAAPLYYNRSTADLLSPKRWENNSQISTAEALNGVEHLQLQSFIWNNISYIFYDQPTMQFSDAERECEKFNKNLFVPSSVEELNSIANIVPEGKCFWIGMNYNGDNFIWLRNWGANIDNLPFQISDDEGYGHVSEENCLSCHVERNAMLVELHWAKCDTKRPFLCQQMPQS